MLLRLLALLVLPPACAAVAVASAAAEDVPAPDPATADAVELVEPLGEAETLEELEVREPSAPGRLWAWTTGRARGIFDYILPETQERRTWRFSLHPRVGDLINRDHVRLPMTLTYGFSEHTEGEFGLDPYFPNPFQDGNGSGSANVRAGFKHQWEPSIDKKVRAATGVRMVHPLSSAPFEFNDGVNRYSIFQTFSRPSPWNPNVEGFVNASYDVLTPSTAEGDIDEDDPQDDFYRVGVGGQLRRKGVVYGLALAFAHTTDGVSTSYTSLIPSVLFDVPSRYMFNSPGQWQLGTSVEAKRYGNENAVEVKVRVRWDVDFRQVMKSWTDARAKARMQARND
jgi:hypothetical protein